MRSPRAPSNARPTTTGGAQKVGLFAPLSLSLSFHPFDPNPARCFFAWFKLPPCSLLLLFIYFRIYWLELSISYVVRRFLLLLLLFYDFSSHILWKKIHKNECDFIDMLLMHGFLTTIIIISRTRMFIPHTTRLLLLFFFIIIFCLSTWLTNTEKHPESFFFYFISWKSYYAIFFYL